MHKDISVSDASYLRHRLPREGCHVESSQKLVARDRINLQIGPVKEKEEWEVGLAQLVNSLGQIKGPRNLLVNVYLYFAIQRLYCCRVEKENVDASKIGSAEFVFGKHRHSQKIAFL